MSFLPSWGGQYLGIPQDIEKILELEENFPVALYLGGQKGTVPTDAQGFRYDAYVSYVDQEPDVTWVWETLVPRLEAAGLRVAVSGDVEEPGVARVVNVERGLTIWQHTSLSRDAVHCDVTEGR